MLSQCCNHNRASRHTKILSVSGKLIVVIGPTAVGKTARALHLAAERNGEVINADSRHIYRRMAIGTNKPTTAEQASARHHLLDLREPDQPFSLAEYLELARAAAAEISARGKTPMLVGGTGQYVKAFIEGWQVPEVPANAQVRAHWQAFADQKGGEALFRELIARDPAAAVTIDLRNIRRVIRALEVMDATGQKWSDLQRKSPLAGDALEIVSLELPRPDLHARADARVDQMLRDGWLEEVRELLAYLSGKGIHGEAALSLPSLSALGYCELAEVLAGRIQIAAAAQLIKHATHAYIRMQDVWFRPMMKRASQIK